MRYTILKLKDVEFLAIDFDQTITTGHVHRYFASFYPELTPNQVLAKIDENGLEWLRKQLLHAAVYTQFMVQPFWKGGANFDEALYTKAMGIFCQNLEGNLIEALETEFEGKFRKIKPFVDEEAIVELLNHRHSLQPPKPTAIVSNSAYAGVIKKTLELLVGEKATYFEVVSPKCNADLTFQQNIDNRIYRVPRDKNAELDRLRAEYEISDYAHVGLIDDDANNIRAAFDLCIQTAFIETSPIYIQDKSSYVSLSKMIRSASPDGDSSASSFYISDDSSDSDEYLDPAQAQATETTRLIRTTENRNPSANYLCRAAIGMVCCGTIIITGFAISEIIQHMNNKDVTNNMMHPII